MSCPTACAASTTHNMLILTFLQYHHIVNTSFSTMNVSDYMTYMHDTCRRMTRSHDKQHSVQTLPGAYGKEYMTKLKLVLCLVRPHMQAKQAGRPEVKWQSMQSYPFTPSSVCTDIIG